MYGIFNRHKACRQRLSALMVANSIFGSGAHSKLFNNVREKLSLCYYKLQAVLTKTKGALFVNAGIEFRISKRHMMKYLFNERMLKTAKYHSRYESSINAIINSLESYKDDQDMLQSFYLGQKIVGTDYDIDTVKKR